MDPSIYFDNNATTLVDPAIADRMAQLFRSGIANPASQHRYGRRALGLLEQSKCELALLSGIASDDLQGARVVLTSGGTEANNLAILGTAHDSDSLVVVGATEHPSILEAAHALGAGRVRLLAADSRGRYDLQQLREWLQHDASRIRLVSLMAGNNETGVLQELQAASAICSQYQVPLHTDAVQAVGKVPLSMSELGLSLLTLTAHKLHGPVGIGALIITDDVKITPRMFGGGQQLEVRPGTEPVVLADSLAWAVRLSCQARQAGEYQRLAGLRDKLERSLVALGDVFIVAADSPRLPHVSNAAFLGLDRQALQMALDFAGIACSTGSACASGSGRPSHVLAAMGLDNSIISSSIRFSLSRMTTADEIDSASRIVAEVVTKLRSKRLRAM